MVICGWNRPSGRLTRLLLCLGRDATARVCLYVGGYHMPRVVTPLASALIWVERSVFMVIFAVRLATL